MIHYQTWLPQAIFFSDWPIFKNLLLHRGHSIDDSYQVSVHLAFRFQRRRFLKIGQSEKKIACGSHVW
jgi:hypothetical protein